MAHTLAKYLNTKVMLFNELNEKEGVG